MAYSIKEIELIQRRIQELFAISSELGAIFPGRKFTLDGHLIGSIGEVIAAFHYGLELLPPSAHKHDAICMDGRMVQIKATQGKNSVGIRSLPEHLIVLWIDDKNGLAYEVYNGPGAPVWEVCSEFSSNGTRHIGISKLRTMAMQVPIEQKINPIQPIPEYGCMRK